MSVNRRVGSVMVCGTASHVGKSAIVAGLCRMMARQGITVAPFKGQNMALNSMVTTEGAEIGRAQAAQAWAAGIEPEAAMNPILLKPTTDRRSQVIVMGEPWKTLDAKDYQEAKKELTPIVLRALENLRSRFDVVVCEGAGSPAEVNLLENDLVNLGLACQADLPAIVVGDIDRGGVFAHLYGTVAMLPSDLRACVRGFVINKFRGDADLLGDATGILERRSGVPTLGVLPWLDGMSIDAEDSLSIGPSSSIGTSSVGSSISDVAVKTSVGNGFPDNRSSIEVVVLRLPRVSNFTDVDALAAEPRVSVRWVERSESLGHPDLVILPGTKATISDLEWVRQRGLDVALAKLLSHIQPPVVLGICGGFQMLGKRIDDPHGVESDDGSVVGLGLLDVTTTYRTQKFLARRQGSDALDGTVVSGYEIHHGHVLPGDTSTLWLAMEGSTPLGGLSSEERPPSSSADVVARWGGVVNDSRGVFGTNLHGLFEGDDFRTSFLARVARYRGKSWHGSHMSFDAIRQSQFDRMADACDSHLDLDVLWDIVGHGASR